MFDKKYGVLYTGVTSDLKKRIYQHKAKIKAGFTNKYDVNKLGYYETHNTIVTAIKREKQIKAGSRNKKVELVESMNPEWNDLYENL